MAADLAKVIARHGEFRETVGKYKIRERNRVRVRLRVGAWSSIYNKTLYRMQHIYYMKLSYEDRLIRLGLTTVSAKNQRRSHRDIQNSYRKDQRSQ